MGDSVEEERESSSSRSERVEVDSEPEIESDRSIGKELRNEVSLRERKTERSYYFRITYFRPND